MRPLSNCDPTENQNATIDGQYETLTSARPGNSTKTDDCAMVPGIAYLWPPNSRHVRTRTVARGKQNSLDFRFRCPGNSTKTLRLHRAISTHKLPAAGKCNDVLTIGLPCRAGTPRSNTGENHRKTKTQYCRSSRNKTNARDASELNRLKLKT